MLRARLGQQALGALEEDRGGRPVAAVVRPPPRPGEQLAGTAGAPPIVVGNRAELAAVSECLLQVVAENLVQLDELRAVPLEP